MMVKSLLLFYFVRSGVWLTFATLHLIDPTVLMVHFRGYGLWLGKGLKFVLELTALYISVRLKDCAQMHVFLPDQ